MKSFLQLQLILIISWIILTPDLPINAQEDTVTGVCFNEETYLLYPHIYQKKPPLPSPFTTEHGTQVLTVRTKTEEYSIIPVTVEHGKPLVYSTRIKCLLGKDNQLLVDSGDFPTLGRIGLHSEAELDQKQIITGLPLSIITATAQPGMYSRAGFMAEGEDIISVLKGDNRIIEALGFTHPQMAEPLFHIWNLILHEYDTGNWARFWDRIPTIFYNGKEVAFQAEGSKGWQISIFQDEIKGMFSFDVRHELCEGEWTFLKDRYPHLSDAEMADLQEKLTQFHFSEMAPYYIKRYGFYEGHTSYRADPIAIAFIFGLKSLKEIEEAFPGRLYTTLTQHFTKSSIEPKQTYNHPFLPIQCTAPEGWRQRPRPEDKLIYEVSDPAGIVHVILWYTETMMTGPAYLDKMADMKGLTYDDALLSLKISDRDAWFVTTSGAEQDAPIRLLLAVIQNHEPLYHTDHNAYFIVQIWCPEDHFEKKQSLLEEIIHSIEITN